MAEPVASAPIQTTTNRAPATVVTGPEFVAPLNRPVELAIVKKGCTSADFDVMDSNGTIIFKVKRHFFSMHQRHELLDATTSKPLITLYAKIFSMRNVWQAFRGKSTDDKDLLFTVKRSKVLQWKTKLHVFVRNNGNPHNYKDAAHDYRVEGTRSQKSCVIYAADSDNIVAQMHKKETFKNFLTGKDHYMVTVYPNVDYAFIAAIIAILHAINTSSGGAGTQGLNPPLTNTASNNGGAG